MNDQLTGTEQTLLDTTGVVPRLLFVLAGPSGVGKNTIIKRVLTNNPLMERVRTFTTRHKRPEEVDGHQYHFVTVEQFRELAFAGKLMEADETIIGHDVYGLGKLYSMPKDIFEEILPPKHMAIAEVDIYGMRRLKERYPDCVSLFVTAPPIDLVGRIRERQDDFMDDKALAHRMQTARDQIRATSEFDYLVFNQGERLDDAVRTIDAIILAERNRVRPGIDLEATLPEGTFNGIPNNEH